MSDYTTDITTQFVTLARLALAGRKQDINLLLRRTAKKYFKSDPVLVSSLNNLLVDMPTRSVPLRGGEIEAVPVDQDSKLQLLRVENPVILDCVPIWPTEVLSSLTLFILEREKQQELIKAGLTPSKSMLFKGPPGVGKTLAARWLAKELNIPLLTLDLSAVMSSYLGHTGKNIRYVLDYAKSINAILLLDEIDAIAKRRDDSSEIGELKRLVTVLLQEIDDWPVEGILLAATNHEELLDPAAFRRFDSVIDFPMPNIQQCKALLSQLLGSVEINIELLTIVAGMFQGESFSDISRQVDSCLRRSLLKNQPLEEVFLEFLKLKRDKLDFGRRRALAKLLFESGMTQMDISHFTGISRDTIRKAVKKECKE